MKTSQATQMVTFSVITLLLTACGTSKSTEVYSDSFSSRSTSTSTSASKVATGCNLRSSNGFSLKLKAVIDNNTRNYRPDLTHIQILDLPSSLGTDGYSMVFHKWFANSGAAPAIDNEALEFTLIDGQTGSILASSKKAFKWADFKFTATGWGVDNPRDFFKRAQIVVDLKDYSATFDALKMTVYDSSNNPIQSVDSLLPPFAVNPRDYAVESSGTARATVLKALHPFANNTTRSTAEYQASASGFCF